jgi:hypothetical protein
VPTTEAPFPFCCRIPNGLSRANPFRTWSEPVPHQWPTRGTDPKVITEAYRKAHERLDNPPWLYIVHDINPRAMSPKVNGFVSPQSWFVDLTLISVQ